MNYNFWEQLNKPFFMLAPMADVTDAAFRQIIAKYGKPDVIYTEFVSTDGLFSPGREVLLHDLKYTHQERPIVAQIFGSRPELFYKTAKLVKQLGFDGVDINMGCPAKNIRKQYAGAELIEHPELAKEIVQATQEGADDMPVSVKTRIGSTRNEIETWLPTLLETQPKAIIIHARTRKEMSKVPARWDVIQQAVEIAKDSRVLMVGNGDVHNLQQAHQRVAQTGVDGVMIGRGIFGNPWLFNPHTKREDISLADRLRVLIEHTLLFDELLGEHKNFDIMKKHFKAYVSGFAGAKDLRIKLMKTDNAQQVKQILEDYIQQNLK